LELFTLLKLRDFTIFGFNTFGSVDAAVSGIENNIAIGNKSAIGIFSLGTITLCNC
jgi:hypothetical protein